VLAENRRVHLRAIQKRIDDWNRGVHGRRNAIEKRDALNDMKSLMVFLERAISSIEKDSCPITGPDACVACVAAVEVARQFYNRAK
jgi:hypothetical protein